MYLRGRPSHHRQHKKNPTTEQKINAHTPNYAAHNISTTICLLCGCAHASGLSPRTQKATCALNGERDSFSGALFSLIRVSLVKGVFVCASISHATQQQMRTVAPSRVAIGCFEPGALSLSRAHLAIHTMLVRPPVHGYQTNQLYPNAAPELML